MSRVRKQNIAGPRILLARLALRPPLTQIGLVRRLQKHGLLLDQGKISRVENGTRALLDYELVAFARGLKVSVGWLCGGRKS